jgi:hypothetical protein
MAVLLTPSKWVRSNLIKNSDEKFRPHVQSLSYLRLLLKNMNQHVEYINGLNTKQSISENSQGFYVKNTVQTSLDTFRLFLKNLQKNLATDFSGRWYFYSGHFCVLRSKFLPVGKTDYGGQVRSLKKPRFSLSQSPAANEMVALSWQVSHGLDVS